MGRRCLSGAKASLLGKSRLLSLLGGRRRLRVSLLAGLPLLLLSRSLHSLCLLLLPTLLLPVLAAHGSPLQHPAAAPQVLLLLVVPAHMTYDVTYDVTYNIPVQMAARGDPGILTNSHILKRGLTWSSPA